ncbi:MGMT family protein [Flavobacteriaceae bacterium]|jgi:methylated-DNA-protein-cysteine methyltransferase-like protein|nr:MGMT family protein [Flavobacteriaceae bacterium]MDA9985156.1 MGMT family protein [Flavobacteriaceae bacterium]MDB2672308.1 MGMT family protein [Flavobacteriaceae bacterium]MDB4187148.1 MGMT family protein [Flavobacteriaceae bacterium]MDB9885953.1 MGMT family protein [Flavobacteriaceae bacterium]
MAKKDKTNFFEKVYAIARQIPEGRITSYGAIAKCIGSPQSARMVGWAMNASHNQEDVPAHRVVNRKGLLTGKHHFEGTNLMQQLLENEGIVVIENQIQNFEEIFWDPSSIKS